MAPSTRWTMPALAALRLKMEIEPRGSGKKKASCGLAEVIKMSMTSARVESLKKAV